MSREATQLSIIADDLTGAADAAGAYGQIRSSAVVLDLNAPWPDAEILAIDTESRYLAPDHAAELVASAVRASTSSGRAVYKKIDSLLRGNVGVEIAASLAELAPGEQALAVVAPAFPATGRSTRAGVVHVGGAPHRSGPYRGDVVEALSAAGLRTGRATVGVRGSNGLARQLSEARDEGLDAVVLDASSDLELEFIARTLDLLDFPTLGAGSGGLASHIIASAHHSDTELSLRSDVSRILLVVGSYSDLARSQIQELLDEGVHHVWLNPGEPAQAKVRGALPPSAMDVLLTPDLALPVDKLKAPGVAASLAATVSNIAVDYDALILTGGETAKAILDGLGVGHMRVLGEIEPGVVASDLPGHLPLLITKAGAFGDAGTLSRIVTNLKSGTRKTSIHK